MNEFDRRWQIGAEHARQVPERDLPETPAGLATRVLARSREEAAQGPSPLLLWDILSRRALVCLAIGLVAAAVSLWPGDSQGVIPLPPLENNVSDLLLTP